MGSFDERPDIGHKVLVAARSSPVFEPDTRAPLARPMMSLTALFETQFSIVLRRAKRLGLTQDSAEDAVQEAFIVVSRKLDVIEPGKEAAFLFRTLVNVVRNQKRAARRRREDLVDGEIEPVMNANAGLVPAEIQLRKEALSFAEKILEEMDLDQRVVFVLFELEEMEVPAIAELLEIPVGTVSSRLRRARETFQMRAAKYSNRGAK